jgi:hypothetical protein
MDDLKAHALFMDGGSVGDSSLYAVLSDPSAEVKIVDRPKLKYTFALVGSCAKSGPFSMLLPSVSPQSFYAFLDCQARVIILSARNYEVLDQDTIEAFTADLDELVKQGMFSLKYQVTSTAHTISRSKPAMWNSLTYRVYIGR